MNTEIIVHPKLQHYGLTTGNLDAMVDWYRTVLGMTTNHRSDVPAEVRDWAPFSALAFSSNDESEPCRRRDRIPRARDDRPGRGA